ncbi:MAG: hypothetical protein ACI4UV_12540 [Victivallales bacterium]
MLLRLSVIAMMSLLSAGLSAAQATAKDLTAEQFMSIVRNPPGRDSWAKMEGYAMHKREGARSVKAPIRMGTLFTPERTIAQITFNKNEVYNIGQTYGENPQSTMESGGFAPGKAQIGIYGINPEDLTMNFIYWKLKVENPAGSVRGQACRVFTLIAPNGKDAVMVYISTDYFFPLRAAWYKVAPDGRSLEKKPFRILEVSGFRKEKDFWLVSRLNLTGGDGNWNTVIRFDETSAGLSKNGIPEDVFNVSG